MLCIIKLKIANTIIELNSKFKIQPLKKEYDWHLRRFFYKGKKIPDITLNTKLRNKIPKFFKAQRMFKTTHPSDSDTNWSLFKKDNRYIIKQCVSDRKQYAILNKNFNRGLIYIINKDDKSWKLGDIIYDILQIILINYFSKKEAVLVHSIGLRDIDKNGLLFVGPTQSGKSSTAHIWHNYSKAKVLNDDRIIIRRINHKFFIYRNPWHGNFNSYPKSIPDRSELKRIFFIYHNSNNTLIKLTPKAAFRYLYPNIFPIFWNKEDLERQVNLCQDLIYHVPGYRLGFKKDKSVISFVRSMR